jgi:hypothetical protein
MENLYLYIENPFSHVAGEINVVSDFSQGYNLTTNQILDYVNTAKNTFREL